MKKHLLAAACAMLSLSAIAAEGYLASELGGKYVQLSNDANPSVYLTITDATLSVVPVTLEASYTWAAEYDEAEDGVILSLGDKYLGRMPLAQNGNITITTNKEEAGRYRLYPIANASGNTCYGLTCTRSTDGNTIANIGKPGAAGEATGWWIQANGIANTTSYSGTPIRWGSNPANSKWNYEVFDAVPQPEAANNITNAGWYTMRLISSTGDASIVGKKVTNADRERFQTSKNNAYALRWELNSVDRGAKDLIYVKPTGQDNTYRVRSSNGHYVTHQGISKRNESEASTNDMTTTKTRIGHWHSYIAGTNDTEKDYTFIGGSSSAAGGNAFLIEPADISAYELWTVTFQGDATQASVINDAQATLTNENNKGLTSVYNGGTFFVTPGTTILPDQITCTFSLGATAIENPIVNIDESTKQIEIIIDNTDYEAIKAEMLPLVGNGIGQFSQECYDNFCTQIENYNNATSNSARKELYEILQNSISNPELNAVANGQYIRISSQTANDATWMFGMSNSASCFTTDETNAIFYYSDSNRLINYQMGSAVKKSGSMLQGKTSAEENNNVDNYGDEVAFNAAKHHATAKALGRYYINYTYNNKLRFVYNAGNASVNGGENVTPASNNYIHYTFAVSPVEALPVDIHSDGFGSIVAPVALAAPALETATLYTASITNGILSFTLVEEAGEVIPANTHVIVKASTSTVNIPIAEGTTAASNHEKLVGSHLSKAIPADENLTYYAKTATVSAANEIEPAAPAEKVTFTKLTPANGKVTVPAGAMVFATENANKDSDAIDIDLATGHNTTGIKEIVADGVASKSIYDLQGRRVNAASKGIYIVNGKKMLVK